MKIWQYNHLKKINFEKSQRQVMDTLVFQLKKIRSKGLVKQLSTLLILKILLLLSMIISSKFQES